MEQKRRSGEGGENAEDARTSEEQRWAEVLREMKVCRFCLDDAGPLSSIYERDAKQTVPLPLQVMACVAIEVRKLTRMTAKRRRKFAITAVFCNKTNESFGKIGSKDAGCLLTCQKKLSSCLTHFGSFGCFGFVIEHLLY